MSFRNYKHKAPIIWLGAIFLYVLIVKGLVYFETQDSTSNIKTLTDGLWFSLITLTTVGYGDYYPVSVGGKILGIIIILSSIGVLGYLIGRISTAISDYLTKQKMGLNGTNLENHFVIIGWNDFANKIIHEIIQSKNKIAIVTDNKESIDAIKSIYPSTDAFTLYNDNKDYDGLKNANIEQSSNVFVNFQDDTETLVYIINLQKRYPNLNYVVLLNSGDLKETFESIGVQYTVSKNEITSKLVASYIFEPDVAMFTDDLMSTSTTKKGIDLQQFKVIERNPFIEKDYLDVFIDLKRDYNTVLVGLSRKESSTTRLIKNPPKGTTILKDDYLIVLADGASKAKLESLFFVKEGKV